MEKSAQTRRLIHTLYLVKQHKILVSASHYKAVKTLLSTFYLVVQKKLTEKKIVQQTMKKPLIELLTALRDARKDLVSRSINEDPQLFSCFFQYENNDNLLTLSFEREYSIFINSNLEKIANHVTDIDDDNTQKKLIYITEEFVGFKKNKKTSSIDAFFLNEKIKQIEKIFSVFDKDKDRIEEINYMRKKEQTLFDRKFKELLGE